MYTVAVADVHAEQIEAGEGGPFVAEGDVVGAAAVQGLLAGAVVRLVPRRRPVRQGAPQTGGEVDPVRLQVELAQLEAPAAFLLPSRLRGREPRVTKVYAASGAVGPHMELHERGPGRVFLGLGPRFDPPGDTEAARFGV